MYKKDTYILGTHLSHNGSACLLKNGRIAVAIEKERITREKHAGGNDKAAVEYCLNAEGITINDIDIVVQNANFEKETLSIHNYNGQRAFPEDYEVPVVTISHHLAHAYSVVGTSPHAQFNVVVIDGSGSPYNQCDDLQGAEIPNLAHVLKQPEAFWCEKLSLYHYNGKTLVPLYKDFSEFAHMQPKKPIQMPTIIHSIGGIYQTCSNYCFGDINHTGKLMGLSPYGQAGAFKKPIFELKDGRVFNTFDWMDNFTAPFTNYYDFKERFLYYANIARYVQDETEKGLLYIFNHLKKIAPHTHWGYAGGVALNAVANQKIKTQPGIKHLYIQPAAGDNGLALGCAYYGWLEILKQKRILHNGSTNFGQTYKHLPTTLDKKAPYKKTETPGWIEEAATLLANGKVIGWYIGGSEFGPRALGFRSILGNPLVKGIKDYINSDIKNREDFRPFAPAILREDVATYFKYDWDSPYMILVNPVQPKWKEVLENVVHLNNTARVQTVSNENNPYFYTLLQQFKQKTGLPILINTSFNKRGMPIVETPEQALDFFVHSPLDALVMENCIYYKENERNPL